SGSRMSATLPASPVRAENEPRNCVKCCHTSRFSSALRTQHNMSGLLLLGPQTSAWHDWGPCPRPHGRPALLAERIIIGVAIGGGIRPIGPGAGALVEPEPAGIVVARRRTALPAAIGQEFGKRAGFPILELLGGNDRGRIVDDQRRLVRRRLGI